MDLKRFSAILIAAMLTASVFAGCGKEIPEREKALKKYADIIGKRDAYSSSLTVKTITVTYPENETDVTDTTVITVEKETSEGKTSAAHINRTASGSKDNSSLDFIYTGSEVYVDFSGQAKLCSAVNGDIENRIKTIGSDIVLPDPEMFSDLGADETSAESAVRYYAPNAECLGEATNNFAEFFKDYLPDGTVSDLNGKTTYDKHTGATVSLINLTVSNSSEAAVLLTYTEETKKNDDETGIAVPDKAGYTEVPEIMSVFDYMDHIENFGYVSGVDYTGSTVVKLSGKPEKTIATSTVLNAKADGNGIITFGFDETSKATNYKEFKDYDLNYKYDGKSLVIKMTGEEDQTMEISQSDVHSFIEAHLDTAAILDPAAITSVTVDSESKAKTVLMGVGSSASPMITDALNKFGFFEDAAVITSYLPESCGKVMLDAEGNLIGSEYHIVFTFTYYEDNEYTCTFDFKAELKNCEVDKIELYSDT